MSTISELQHFITQHDLLPDGSRIVVGVSGGPDSLSLLHVLSRLAGEHGWHVHAAYLHHGLRPAADVEMRYVAEVAAAWGLGCTVERYDVRALAAQPGVSLEEAARQARYAFLAQVAQRCGARIVAVGHHADDQVETVLMHLLRGSGLAGLRGMLPKIPMHRLRLLALPPEQRRLPTDIWLVRPWLQTSRDAILAYCQEHDLQPLTDTSNADTTFFRNRLRHEVIPLLRQINPRLTRVIGHTAAALQGDYDALAAHRRQLWQALAKVEPQAISFSLPAFLDLPVGDQRALLRRAIGHLRPDLRNINWAHTEDLLVVLHRYPQRRSGGPYPLVAGLQAWLAAGALIVAEESSPVVLAPQVGEPQPLSLPGVCVLEGGWQLVAQRSSWEKGQAPPWASDHDPSCIWLPIHVSIPLRVRARRPGDRMRPFGLGGSKEIKTLMTDIKLPRPARARWPLLVDAHDRILWLVGQRCSELCRLPAGATEAWQICLQPPTERISDPV